MDYLVFIDFSLGFLLVWSSIDFR